ncbi:MAG: glycosyltransferase family 39 protein [Sulfurovum sp.]|nr:glycosyltransferase family 39 protein [Sulfurovum sp.]
MEKHWKFILLLSISAMVLFINVGSYGLIESSDARYAEIARAMYLSGDYMHPNLMDVHHYHKPPFTYQITALGYNLFGINSFGARFFLQIAILIQLILVYALTLQLFSKKETALWAAMIYFSFPLVLVASRNLTTDAFLTMFALLSMYTWVRYRKEGTAKYLYFFTLSLALGFLTKGPVIFIVPILFIFVYNRTEPSKNSFGYHHLFAWLLFVAVAFSWFIYLAKQDLNFLNYFLGHQTVDRFAKNAFSRTEPFWYFLLFAPLVGLPWLIILPYLLKIKKTLFTKKSLYTALLIGILVPLIFFSISSSKRILYILPFYSLLAVLIAQLLSTLSDKKSKVINTIVFAYAMIILLTFSATLTIETKFVIPAVLGIVGILLILPVVWIYKNDKMTFTFRAIVISFIVSLFLLGGSSSIMTANQLQLKSLKPIADFIISKGLKDRNILIYNTRKPSLAFHLNKSVISLYDGDQNLKRETQFEEDIHWKKYLIDLDSEEESTYLKEVLTIPTVLVVYKNVLPEKRKWIQNAYKQKEVMGKWSVYY